MKTTSIEQERDSGIETPRVTACIAGVMARFPGASITADARYFQEVHQHLAPLARKLERELIEARAAIPQAPGEATDSVRQSAEYVTGEQFYRALYEHTGGQWAAVCQKNIWRDAANRLNNLLAADRASATTEEGKS